MKYDKKTNIRTLIPLVLLFLMVGMVYGNTINEKESNDIWRKANKITLNDTGIGKLHDNGWSDYDVDDWWKFTPTQSGSLRIYTTDASKNINAELLNNSFLFLTNFDYSRNNNVDMTQYVTAGKTYYLDLYYADWSDGITKYQLHFDFTPINTNITTSERPFTLRTQYNIRGDYKMVGNTVLCHEINGKCVNTTLPNNYLTLSYINILDDDNYTNSSKAEIDGIPSDAVIKWVGFYTQGDRTDESLSQLETDLKTTPSYLFSPDNTKYTIYPQQIDILGSGSPYTFSTFAEVKSLEGKSGSYFNGWWTGANIQTQKGYNRALGYFGAWNIVVVYEENGLHLKNISIYDGYREVYDSRHDVTIDINGFLTPYHGTVNSKMSVFAGEGDAAYKGDQMLLSDKENPSIDDYTNVNKNTIEENNAFDSTTNGFTANPSLSNNFGIDIHNYDVGTNGLDIIKNGDTSASIKLTTNGDIYFPNVVVFATDLYEPRVCYYIDTIKDDNGTTIFQNGSFIEGKKINPGTNYHFNFWIANMEKPGDTSDDIETAQKVQIYAQMKQGFNYKTNSTEIKNLGDNSYIDMTDATGDDLADFDSDTNESTWRVGTGADATEGGTLPVASSFDDNSSKAFIALQGNFTVDDNTTQLNLEDFYSFKASFKTNTITVDPENALPIDQCVDQSLSVSVNTPPAGAFTVVNQNFNDSNIPSDGNSPVNALYTQIVGKPFDVKILSLDSLQDGATTINLKNFDNGTYSNDINISVISTPDYNACGNDQICKEEKCKNATEEQFIQTKDFGNNKIVDMPNIIINKALKDASFRIKFINNEGNTSYACSLDSFSVRPKDYKFDMNETHLIGAKEYILNEKAENEDNNQTSGYDQTVDTNISLVIPTGCSLPKNENNITTNFYNGDVNTQISTDNIGDYNISVSDKKWTYIDQIPKSDSSIDCIPNSSADQPNSEGKVGCDISGYKVFSFSPKKFLNTLSINNGTTNNYTYISNDKDMSANISITTKAILENNSTATNYTAKCYAKDINTTLKLDKMPLSFKTVNFFDDNGITSIKENDTNNTATFFTKDGNFTNGTTTLNIKFNFDRNISKADNPFKISKNDFNITSIVDTNGTTGEDFDRSTDKNITFYYGRVHAPDYSTKGDTINAKIYYEIYCKNCNQSLFSAIGKESVDSAYWYINKDENSTNDGKIYNFITSSMINPVTPSSTVSNGEETDTFKYNAGTYPYKERVDINASSWLIFNPYDDSAKTNSFSVEYLGNGGWSGVGKTGKTVDLNISSQGSQRLEW